MKQPTEHQEQCRVFEWSRSNIAKHAELALLHASLNGVKLSPGAAKKAWLSGMLSGIPDMFLPIPRNGKHGLFIEQKRKKGGVTSDKQKKMLAILNQLGYDACVCKGAEEAIAKIKEYLGGF